MNAPIALFTFARYDHTCRTVEALLSNHGVGDSDLIIFSDAARSPKEQEEVKRVRAYLETLTGFRSITLHFRHVNYGLARSIIEGVTQVLSEYDRVIVLEDDMVTSPYFLDFMNKGLKRFYRDERVISVHGYVFPVKERLTDAFFLQGADCWGWGTWRRGWDLFNPNGQALLNELTRRGLVNAFDFNGTYKYSEMLRAQILGENDSWAVRWYASAFLAEKLTLYPGQSLVLNIGNDNSGVHCAENRMFDVELGSVAVDISQLEVRPSVEARIAFEGYFRASKLTLSRKLWREIKRIVSRVFA